MNKRWVTLIAIATMATTMLSACGGDKEEKKNAAPEDLNSKLEVSWLNILHTASPPTDTIKSLLEEYTNSKITFNWVPDASKEERITTALASGSLQTLSP